MTPPPLAELGRRIVILGPSGVGKSTLAAALSDKLDVPAIHLDALFHQPHTKWEPRSAGEFETLHAAAIAADAWVSDGNYSRTLPERLARSTGVIWIDVGRWAGFRGYVARCLGTRRLGRLEGAPDGINWKMTRYILIEQPRKRDALAAMIATQSQPVLRLTRMAQLTRLYEDWALVRLR